ncbi:ABC transporter ATP-binding protein [Oceanirhabdus seepicola]|uniref:ABC transporter ATP-binding protein n=1 Tax=Oceanirhabdus seepicola TaxID=2828781 RepID=A0A9J6NXX5_9CLOT|nr:ABC transporter ATP-binding protein [Oceanirhabdus seepicola]MCM1989367.1 ABC transporter ATP-binding protein [Oceanirhabdus seepicola]
MIRVNNLSFGYYKNKKILKDINFHVKEGEIFGFLGPNGSGKSTTQKLLMGVLSGNQGDILINYEDIKNKTRLFYEDIGVLFEIPYLYNTLSAVDNLKYFSSFYKKSNIRDIEELLDCVELKTEYRKKQVKHYSKGMKQRTSVARSLINNPRILFLDEPISGLDPAGAILIKNIIKKEKEKGTTIFLTTHNMFVADELCDRVAFISDGYVETIDTPRNLKSTYGDSGESTLEDVFVKLTGRRLSDG